MGNSRLSPAVESCTENTRRSNKYRHDPYLVISDLIKVHRDLIVDGGFIGSDRWMEHLEHDLMPFWMNDEVKDMPSDSAKKPGLHRSFFTDDGKKLPGLDKVKNWPEVLRKAIDKDKDGNYTAEAGGLLEGPDRNADKNFVRAHSRQVFVYGAAYHMTGKAGYFELCQKGANVLMGLVNDDGTMPTKQDLASGGYITNDVMERTSQDLAYGMMGMAFYYYLTHDDEALAKIKKLYAYIKSKYYDPGMDAYMWIPYENNEDNKDKQRVELVAHLDQIYAYMLWLMPSLPKDGDNGFRAEVKADMKNIVRIMIERFYTEVHGTFWGASNSSEMLALGTAHTDFGHSVKTMWVIYQVGIWTGDSYLVNFARTKIHGILRRAYDDSNGSWNRRVLDDGTVEKDKEWWSLAELNQAAALLAIKDPSYLQYLNKTYAFWFKNMVDYKNREIWHVLDGETLYPKRIFPKAHCWKNGFHTLEHTLIGYITSKQILDKEIELYYAFKDEKEVVYHTVTPYFFKANIVKDKVKDIGWGDVKVDGRKNIKVVFNSLH